MTRDELSERILQTWDATNFKSYPGTTMALAAADAALAALAPKLTWTEWEPRWQGRYFRSELHVGRMSIAYICRHPDRVIGAILGVESMETDNTPEAIAALRTEIERRVREAMS